MNKRQYQILSMLRRKHEYVTFGELADELSVSVKTIRNDIAAMKEYLAEEHVGELETKPHAGVRLRIPEEAWQKICQSEPEEDREILFFIIRQLLKNGSLTAQRLAEQYYIGRTQLDKILDTAQQWFFENHILFERKRGKGILIQYSEWNYRLARLRFYQEYLSEYEKLPGRREAKSAFMNAGEYSAMCAALSGFETDRTAALIAETEQEFGLHFNYVSGVNLLFLTSLCIVRSRAGNEIKMPETQSIPTDGESGTLFSEALAERLEEAYKIRLSKEERGFLKFLADVSEIQEFESEEERRSFEGKNVELCRFTVKLVNILSEVADLALREDRIFVKQMFLQLKATISRLKYGIVFKNQLLGQIKAKYPNMMAVAWFLENIFEKELGLELNEHEVGFLALHIGGAIERQLSGLTACIVCDYGIGISQILREKITRSIPELKITAVYSGRDIQKIKQDSCDFVITTTSLDGYRLNRDMITVGHLLEESDIRHLEDYMKKARSGKNTSVREIIPNVDLFSEELIFPQCRVKSKKELLEMLCERMESLGYVTDGFLESVWEREKSAPTDLGKGFSLPHGMSEYVNHSAAAFASLEEPIDWVENGEPVDMVFLVAFDLDEDDAVKKKIIGFYQSIVSFMEDDQECEKLRSLTDAKQIIKILETW